MSVKMCQEERGLLPILSNNLGRLNDSPFVRAKRCNLVEKKKKMNYNSAK